MCLCIPEIPTKVRFKESVRRRLRKRITYTDWARATREYLKRKYGVRGELEEIHVEDPDRDKVILNIFATNAKAVIPFEVNVTKFVASEMRNRTILCRNTSM